VCQLFTPSPRPPTSLVSPTANRATVVRGGASAKVGEPPRSRPLPAVSTVDFSALYEHCLASGFKARVVFSYAAGVQVINMSCSLPTSTMTAAATAVKRCCRRHRRRLHGRAACAVGASPAHLPSPVIIAPAGAALAPAGAALAPAVATPAGGKACMPSPTPLSPHRWHPLRRLKLHHCLQREPGSGATRRSC
jgi:hypothetical protein